MRALLLILSRVIRRMTTAEKKREKKREKFDWLRAGVDAYAYNPSWALFRAFELRAFARKRTLLKPPILDLCCGDGLFARQLFSGLGCDYSRKPVLTAGIDLSKPSAAAAERSGVYERVVLGDARATPFANASFQTIISNSSVEHVPDTKRVLKEAARLLRSNGAFVFTVPSVFFKPFEDAEEKELNLFEPGEWKTLLRGAGFESARTEALIGAAPFAEFARLKKRYTTTRAGKLRLYHVLKALQFLPFARGAFKKKFYEKLKPFYEDERVDENGEYADLMVTAFK